MKKAVNLKRVILYVSASLILLSAVVYFMPLIAHTNPSTLNKINFSGFDFTKAIFSQEVSMKMFATQNLFDIEATKSVAYAIAIISPITFIYSLIMFALTIISTYKKQYNNFYVIGGYFMIWVILLICVLFLVSSLAVTKGEITINNYGVAFGMITGLLSAISASILNGFSIFFEKEQ